MLKNKLGLNNTKSIRQIFIHFLAYFLPMLAAVLLAALLFYKREVSSHGERFANNEIHNVQLAREITSTDFRTAIHDMELLLAHAALQKAVTSHNSESARSDYASEVFALAKVKPLYDHICVFDRTGREIVRVQTKAGKPRIVPAERLGATSSYYFTQTMQLDSGRVYVSPVDASVEHGHVLLPPAPVIHLGSVAFDRRGKRIGCVLVDFSLSRLFADLMASDAKYPGCLLLLNPLGYPTYGQWNRDDWWALGAGKNGNQSSGGIPEAWNRISREVSGQFSTGDGLFTFDTIYLAEKHRALPKIDDAGRRVGTAMERTPDRGYWKIVSFAPTNVMSTGHLRVKRRIVQICAIVLFVMALWSGLLGRAVAGKEQVAENLRQSEFFLRESQRVSRIGSFVLEIASGAMSASQVLSDIFGVDADDGFNIEEWLEWVNPEDRGQIDGYLKEHVIAGRQPFNREFRILRQSDGNECWVHVRGKLKLSDDGEPLRLIGTVQDITERKREEEKRAVLLDQLHHAQKLETIGTLAGGIAHDFNNILQAIHGYVDMSLDEVPAESQVHHDLQQVAKATQRAMELVRQILTFSRHDLQERQPIRLHLVVRDALSLLRPALPASIELRKSLDPSCDPVLANAGQMHQVVMNLCTNAYQSMGERGVLSVRLAAVEIDAERGTMPPGFLGGKCVRLTVRDTGTGMDKETARHIFEPFFTTKEVGRGTGLGLSVVHGIVETHGGNISVETAPGEGTIFCVTLPVHSATISEPRDRETPSYAGSEAILLVEDDELVAAVVTRLLAKGGYNVIRRSDGRDALDTFLANPEKFDLVITDQTMPKMTGNELAVELRKVRCDIPIILMSGFGHLAATSEVLATFDEIVGKPVEVKELGLAIRRALKGKQEREI